MKYIVCYQNGRILEIEELKFILLYLPHFEGKKTVLNYYLESC